MAIVARSRPHSVIHTQNHTRIEKKGRTEAKAYLLSEPILIKGPIKVNKAQKMAHRREHALPNMISKYSTDYVPDCIVAFRIAFW